MEEILGYIAEPVNQNDHKNNKQPKYISSYIYLYNNIYRKSILWYFVLRCRELLMTLKAEAGVDQRIRIQVLADGLGVWS